MRYALSYPFRKGCLTEVFLTKYGGTVALENGYGHLPTTWQESELTLRNDGFLHHNVMIAAGVLSYAQCW